MGRRRWTISVRVEGRNVLISGWKAVDILQSAGLRPVYIGVDTKAWVVDRLNAADAFAALEHSGAWIKYDESVNDLPQRLLLKGALGQSSLFDGGAA